MSNKRIKLDIIVPRYKEPWEMCHYLFDSLAVQRGINFEDIRVVLVNDGEEDLLDKSVFERYPYKVEYIAKKHGGVSAARNYGLDYSNADYVMFCDDDDMFINSLGLHLVFQKMEAGFDTLMSNFIEEQYDSNGKIVLIRHDKDITFVHGKVHNRKFLVKNKLRFCDELTMHEDGYFNALAATVAKKSEFIDTPFYMWRWNDNSVVRREVKGLLLRTYDDLIRAKEKICEQLTERGLIAQRKDAVVKTTMDIYYDFNKPEFLLDENKELVQKAAASFRRFFSKYGKDFADTDIHRIGELAFLARTNAYKNGFILEGISFNDWLKRILNVG